MAVFDELVVPHSPPPQQQWWRSPWWLLLIVLGALVGATVVGAVSPNFSRRWLMWWLWFLPLMALLALTILPPRGLPARKLWDVSAAEPDRPTRWMCFLAALGSLFYVPHLSSYPFPVVGDQIRDGGLRAQEIALGTRLDLFGFDFSQGLFFATFNSFFYDIFGPSVLVYRIPGFMFCLITGFLIFEGFGRLFGYRLSALVAAIVGSNSALLFFARTEPLISYSVLLTAAAMILAVRLIEGTPEEFESLGIPSGALLGLTITAHAGARAPVVALIGGAWLFSAGRFLVAQSLNSQRVVSCLCVLSVAIFAGCGPAWVELVPELFLGTGSLPAEYSDSILMRMARSLAILFEGELAMHYDRRPLFSPWFSFLMAAAIVFCLLRGSRFSKLCCAMILLTIFTNSAMTDLVMGGHRVVMLVLFVACIVAECFTRLSQLQSRRRQQLLEVVFAAVLCWEGSRFFTQQRAILEYTSDPAALPVVSLRHLVNHLSASERWQGVQRVALVAREGSQLHEFLQPLHIAEFFQYFLPGREVVVVPDKEVAEGILLVAPVPEGSPFPRAVRRIEMPKTPFGTPWAPPVYEVFWDPPMVVPVPVDAGATGAGVEPPVQGVARPAA